MVRGTNTKGLVLLLIVFWATCADSAPTFSSLDSGAEARGSCLGSVAKPELIPAIREITGRDKSRLAEIAGEFHRPTVRYSSGEVTANAIKSLPPAPGTFVLVLLGFLSITLVRERKLWLAAAASVLWAGYAGFAVLPQLASHLGPRGRAGRCCCNSLRASGPVAVRRLAGSPGGELSISSEQLPAASGSCGSAVPHWYASVRKRGAVCVSCARENADRKFKVHQSAIAVLPECLDSAYIALAEVIRQFLCFSCNSVSFSLARGPPMPTHASTFF